MKMIRNKLQSNRGATMVLSLIFMLICVFVGGSVLVAATVNGGRMENQRTDQQAILNQRSIAAVIGGELTKDGTISLSFALGENAAGQKTILLPVGGVEGVKRAIFNATRAAFESVDGTGSDRMTVSFQDPSGETVSVACTVTATVRDIYVENEICFDENPKITISLQALEGSSSVSWYDIRVRKGGAAE